MRFLALASLLTTTLLAPVAALADVGPPPSCPEGTHREYDRGYRCVSDAAPIADPPAPEPLPSTEPDAPPAPPTSAASTAGSLTAAPSPPASPPSHACGCTTVGRDSAGDHLALALSAAFLLTIGARRRRPAPLHNKH